MQDGNMKVIRSAIEIFVLTRSNSSPNLILLFGLAKVLDSSKDNPRTNLIVEAAYIAVVITTLPSKFKFSEGYFGVDICDKKTFARYEEFQQYINLIYDCLFSHGEDGLLETCLCST